MYSLGKNQKSKSVFQFIQKTTTNKMNSSTSYSTEAVIKCLQNVATHPHKTQRLIQISGKIPNSVKTWKHGGITKTCEYLGIKLQDKKSLEKEATLVSKLCGKATSANSTTVEDNQTEKRIVGDKEIQQQPIQKHNLKRSFPDEMSQRNYNSSNNDTNNKGVESCNRLDYNNFQQPQRTFSPPRQIPKTNNSISSSSSSSTTVNNPNRNFKEERTNNNNYHHYPHHMATTSNSNSSYNVTNNSSKIARFEDPTKNSIRTTPSTMNQNSRNSEVKLEKEIPKPEPSNPFKTAREMLEIDDKNKGIKRNLENPTSNNVRLSGLTKKLSRPEPPQSKPQRNIQKDEEPISDNPEVVELMENPLLKNIDPKMVEAILNDMVDTKPTSWNDIAGLEAVKKTIREIIVWPMQRPDIFNGLRGPPKGILFFGPPGTGKTMMGRLIATESKSSFFSISASSLTSKWIGDGEKMVRALFAVARVKQPAVIFIDEIDSILTQRSETEHESSRRLKTEFLIQFDGCGTNSEDRILVIGVTNRPQELDEAARRRLVKRIYIPLPCAEGRKQLIQNMLKGQQCSMSESDYTKISELTDGYSGSDISSVCREAAYGPLRDVGVDIMNTCADELRPMEIRDFEAAMKHVKSSVDKKDLVLYEDWDQKFGCLHSS